MRGVAATALEWTAAGHRWALATVVRTRGSSPRPSGAAMAVRDDGLVAGSVSGGCVEGAAVSEALKVLDTGRPRLLEFGEASDDGWEVGLSCGGSIQVWVERPALEEDGPAGTAWWDVLRLAEAGRGAVRIASLDPQRPAHLVWRPGGEVTGDLEPEAWTPVAAGAYERREERVLERDGVPCFVQVLAPPDRLLIVGAVHIAVPLVRMARDLGFATEVVDPRSAFAADERFPDAPDRLVCAWPQEAFENHPPDAETYAALLTHDPKIDDPALELLLRSPAPYIGALGGRSTQSARRERMRAQGFSEADLERIRGPVGLPIGAETPEEIAVAILAEIVQTRRRR